MAEDNTTRQRILETAGALFQRQGYHATGLNQVLAEGRAPKGSLYFHFPGGKEQLGAEAVTLSSAGIGQALGEIAGRKLEPAAALAAMAERLGAGLVGSGFHNGCPVATIALDVASDSEPIRTSCADAYDSWTEAITAGLVRWQVPQERREALATTILATFEGALLLARVRRDLAPLRMAAEQLALLVTTSIG